METGLRLCSQSRMDFRSGLQIDSIQCERCSWKSNWTGPAWSRDKKLPVLAQTARARNFVARHPKLQLFNVSLPTQLQSVLAHAILQRNLQLSITDSVLAQIESILKRNLKNTFPDRILAQIGLAQIDIFGLLCKL